jgi:hypothetical protein
VHENIEIVKKNLEDATRRERIFGNLRPISKAPSLRQVFGLGFKIYGHKDFDVETQSYLTTYYFVVLGIPVFPIRRYRVINEGNLYRFLGKARLRKFDKWHLGISLSTIGLLLLLLVFGAQGTSSYIPSTPGADSTQQASGTPPAAVSSSNNPSTTNPDNGQPSLLNQINTAKADVEAIELELTRIDLQLKSLALPIDDYKASIKNYESQADLGQEIDKSAYDQAIRSHNTLVDQYNAILARRQTKYAGYKAGIAHVNEMVNQYNAGSR